VVLHGERRSLASPAADGFEMRKILLFTHNLEVGETT
jgi:hypothetical protein